MRTTKIVNHSLGGRGCIYNTFDAGKYVSEKGGAPAQSRSCTQLSGADHSQGNNRDGTVWSAIRDRLKDMVARGEENVGSR